ncbi:MAG: UPF0179 family protein [Candidatus Helarchaeota archaeon]
MDKIVTLIGVKLARKNRKFLFAGPSEECEECNPSLRSVCIDNLEKGCIYEIIAIRKITHSCAIHEGGVTVVEVQKPPIKVALPTKLSYEGAFVPFKFTDCDEESCPNYQYCKPLGIVKEDKYKISKVIGNLPEPCKKGKELKLVELLQ